jgi:hypothetical protein
MRLGCGTLGRGGSLFESRLRELSFQIPAKAGTTKRALAGFRSGMMRGFRSGLKPELRTQKGRRSFAGGIVAGGFFNYC